MLNIFKSKSDKLAPYLESEAVIIDVRTPEEFRGGHVKNSVNIPLGKIASEVGRIKKMKKDVITCCASGMRSGNAAMILNNHGINSVNGGSWSSVQKAVRSFQK